MYSSNYKTIRCIMKKIIEVRGNKSYKMYGQKS